MINETFIINHRRDKDLGALISSFMGLYHACQLCSFPGEGNGYPLQYSGLENSKDCIVHGRRRQWHPTPVLLPGKSHGWRSLVACSPWGRYESDAIERLHFHFSLLHIGEGNGNPLQCSCLENPRDRGAWCAAVYGVAQSWTWLKRLSSSSIVHGIAKSWTWQSGLHFTSYCFTIHYGQKTRLDRAKVLLVCAHSWGCVILQGKKNCCITLIQDVV